VSGASRIAVVGSAVGALLCAWLWRLSARNPDAYYRALQEDGVLEWATVFAFLFAAGGLARAALRPAAIGARATWSAAGLALFCALVALEEISWGQRLIGYRPPAYFLEHNFQQELNLHNVASGFVRELVLVAVLGAWGCALPLALRRPRMAALAARTGLLAPPLALAPGFGASLALYLAYPLPFTGEIVELLLGAGLLVVALAVQPGSRALGWPRASVRIALAGCALVLPSLGLVAWWSARPADPARIEEARREVEALAADLAEIARREDEAPTGCGLHKRVYTFARDYQVADLRRLGFAALAERGADPERIAWFLDPWNSPYWVRDECGARERRSLFVYSFGPDRRRDSSEWEVGGDDVGAYLLRR
jgi:hypothetical protein